MFGCPLPLLVARKGFYGSPGKSYTTPAALRLWGIEGIAALALDERTLHLHHAVV
jgi:hypothetical protein